MLGELNCGNNGALWRATLDVLAGLELILAIGFTLGTASAFNACYVTPCYEGAGLQELWKVNKGIGFTGLAAGGLSIAHAVLAIWLAPKPAIAQEAPLVLGVFISVTLVVSHVIMDQACIWGAEWNLVSNLLDLEPSNAVLYESGRRMVVREDMLLLFVRLEFAAVGLLALQCSVVLGLLLGHRQVIKDLRLLSTNGGFSRIPGDEGRGRWGGGGGMAGGGSRDGDWGHDGGSPVASKGAFGTTEFF